MLLPAVIRAAGPSPVPAKPQTSVRTLEDLEPPWHVILLDDDEHTYAYVVEMLMSIFGYELEKAFKMAATVDAHGRVIVATVHKELAELRLDQIQTYGSDPRVKNCRGSMSAVIEPAE